MVPILELLKALPKVCPWAKLGVLGCFCLPNERMQKCDCVSVQRLLRYVARILQAQDVLTHQRQAEIQFYLLVALEGVAEADTLKPW